jgi:hypothetical protein
MVKHCIQENTSNLGGFLNGREQERYSMPLALSFLYNAIGVIPTVVIIGIRKKL